MLHQTEKHHLQNPIHYNINQNTSFSRKLSSDESNEDINVCNLSMNTILFKLCQKFKNLKPIEICKCLKNEQLFYFFCLQFSVIGDESIAKYLFSFYSFANRLIKIFVSFNATFSFHFLV